MTQFTSRLLCWGVFLGRFQNPSSSEIGGILQQFETPPGPQDQSWGKERRVIDINLSKRNGKIEDHNHMKSVICDTSPEHNSAWGGWQRSGGNWGITVVLLLIKALDFTWLVVCVCVVICVVVCIVVWCRFRQQTGAAVRLSYINYILLWKLYLTLLQSTPSMI